METGMEPLALGCIGFRCIVVWELLCLLKTLRVFRLRESWQSAGKWIV